MKRKEIGIFTAILCFMVVYIHVTSEAVSNYDKESLVYAIAFFSNKAFSFVVPAFIFSSSLKFFMGFAENKPYSYGKFIWGRIRKIYLPYIFWAFVYYLFFVYCKRYFPFSFVDLGRYMLFGSISAPFYFIVIIMQFYLLMPVWRKIGRIQNKRIMWLIPVLGGIFSLFMLVYANGFAAKVTGKPDFKIPYNDRIFTSYLLYWLAGIFCGLHYESLSNFMKNKKKILFTGYATVAPAHLILCYLSAKGAFYYRYAEHFQMLFNVVSLFMLFSLCFVLADKAKKLYPFFSKIAGASFYIYLTHCLVLVFVESLMNKSITSITVRLVVKAVVVFVVPTTLSIFYSSYAVNFPIRNLLTIKKKKI